MVAASANADSVRVELKAVDGKMMNDLNCLGMIID